MSNRILSVNFQADIAIPNNRIVKHGTGDRNVTFCTAATDFSIGVLNEMPAGVLAGERLDIERVGIPSVECGAAVPRGSPLTSDAVGRAIVAAPAAGSNVRIIGFADEAGTAAGDVIRYLAAPGVMQG